jgi:simple sugar transport system permease protein
MPLLLTLGVVLVVVALAAILVSSVGVSPTDAASAFWDGSFGSMTSLGLVLTQAVPLTLVALAWIIVFRAGRIHVGFPGQIIAGGICAATIALNFPGLPGILHLPLALVAGAVGGAFYAGIAAWLWARRGVQEIVSTLLLNLVAVQILAWVLRGPLQQSGGGEPQTDAFAQSALWPRVPGVEGLTLSWSVVLIPAAVALVVFVLRNTSIGFRLRLVGANPTAARWSGYRPQRIGVGAMVVSGLIAGIAGANLLLAGDTPGMAEGFQAQYGFDGIAVALLARNSPIGSVFAAIFFAALNVGSSSVEALLNVPSTVASVLQGLIIILVLVSATILARRRRQAEVSHEADEVATAEPLPATVEV